MESPLLKIKDKKRSFLLSEKMFKSVSKINSFDDNYNTCNTCTNTKLSKNNLNKCSLISNRNRESSASRTSTRSLSKIYSKLRTQYKPVNPVTTKNIESVNKGELTKIPEILENNIENFEIKNYNRKISKFSATFHETQKQPKKCLTNVKCDLIKNNKQTNIKLNQIKKPKNVLNIINNFTLFKVDTEPNTGNNKNKRHLSSFKSQITGNPFNIQYFTPRGTLFSSMISNEKNKIKTIEPENNKNKYEIGKVNSIKTKVMENYLHYFDRNNKLIKEHETDTSKEIIKRMIKKNNMLSLRTNSNRKSHIKTMNESYEINKKDISPLFSSNNSFNNLFSRPVSNLKLDNNYSFDIDLISKNACKTPNIMNDEKNDATEYQFDDLNFNKNESLITITKRNVSNINKQEQELDNSKNSNSIISFGTINFIETNNNTSQELTYKDEVK